tara:strand:- start:40105 stop:40470 length:366 start_codon:yes stop_codon:yes gene_type:complete
MAKFKRETFRSEPSAPKFKKEKPRKKGSSKRSKFKKERSNRDRPRSSDRFRGKTNSPMHRVKCDKCKKMCDVPFLPTENKPVYCSNCFRKEGSSGGRTSNIESELKDINKKLDRLLKGLDL